MFPKLSLNFMLCITLLLMIINCRVKAQEEEEGDAIQKRSDFFFNPRKYPVDSIPSDAYINAMQDKINMQSSSNFSLTFDTWQPIGPQTVQPGIFSGRIGFVKYDPRDPDIVYLGAANGGIWKSTNGGNNWLSKTDRLKSLSCGAIAIDEENGIIYYGSGDAVWTSVGYTGTGIFKSTDYGESWELINSTGLPYPTQFFRLAIDPHNENRDIIYAAMPQGLYKTVDRGLNWSRVLPDGTENRQCTDVVISPYNNNIYAVGPGDYCEICGTFGIGGLWKSSNNGANWVHMTSTGFPHFGEEYPIGRTHITLYNQSSNNPDILYIITSNDQTYGDHSKPVFVYKSTNSGENFTYIQLLEWYGSNAMYDMFISVSPHDPNLCFAGTVDLYRTANGNTFESIAGNGSPNHYDYHCMDFHPSDDDYIIIGQDGGTWRSNNKGVSGSYTNLNASLQLTQLYRVASNPFNKSYVSAGAQDMGYIWKMSDNNHNWYWQVIGDGGTVVCSKIIPGLLLFSINNSGQVGYSFGNGFENGGFSEGYQICGYDWLSVLEPHPTEGNTFFLLRNDSVLTDKIRMYRTTDGGQYWGGSAYPFSSVQNSNLAGTQPENLAISSSNPDIMYFTTGNRIQAFHHNNPIFKSTDGGAHWINNPIAIGGYGDLPNKFISHLEIDPGNPEELLLTMSGFNTGHIFRSTNGGSNWTDISGNLPNIPANDIITIYTGDGGNDKEYIVATDAGVFRTLASYIEWSEIDNHLPNSAAVDLEYSNLLGILRVATFGRGVWETNVQGPIYVKGIQYLNSDESGLKVSDDIIVCSGGKLRIPYGCTIKMPAGKKIIIEDGGQINITGNETVTFTSQSGSWGGIEIQDGGYGTIKNAVFNNTETPIVINSNRDGGNDILIQNCVFNSGSVTVNGRDNVTISLCTTNSPSASTGTAISANYSENLLLSQNTINDCWAAGIMVSNSSPVLLRNTINHSEESNSAAGISLDNCYSGTVNYNKIYHYCNGIYLYYSSPTMLENTVVNNTTSMSSNPSALTANYLSSPRLNPIISEEGTIWDAGINSLKTNNQGNGIYLYEFSIPNIDYGYNSIYGYDYHLSGWIGEGGGYEYYARNNCWAPDEIPVRENISDAVVFDDPFTCDPPEGASQSGGDPDAEAEMALIPPAPIIINYGNGIIDTIKVTNGHFPLSADQLLFSQGLDEEIAGNYQQAINKYKLVVQNYQDSAVAISAMKKILHCSDKLQVDTNAYSQLRAYYLNLSSQNANDTGFVKAANEMASKCLVRTGEYPGAVTEYEDVVQSSNDSLEVLCAELNIIETYMIMEREGDSPGFVGQLRQLKP